MYIQQQRVRRRYGKIQFCLTIRVGFSCFKEKEQAGFYGLDFLKWGMSVPTVPPSVLSCLLSQFYLISHFLTPTTISVSERLDKSICVHFSLVVICITKTQHSSNPGGNS